MSVERPFLPQSRSSTPALTRHTWAISTKQIWLIILVTAVLLRVASALIQGESVVPLPGVFDQVSYDGLAQRVIDGYGFSFGADHWPATRAGEPTAHWSYLYTLYLAATYALFGVHPLAARLIQAVLAGVLHCWLAERLGRRIFGPRVGLAAAGLSAIYIYFFYYAGALITEPFYITGILWTFDVALRLVDAQQKEQPRAQKWRLWIELGVAIGVTALLRQLFLLFVPFLFLWLWWMLAFSDASNADRSKPQEEAKQSSRRGWQAKILAPVPGFVVATSLIILLIVPWTVRNYLAFGTLVPLNTNAGYAFFWGNHPIYGTDFVGILPGDGPTYLDLIPTELRPLNEAELDRALLKLGIGFVQADPVRYMLLSVSRTREYFKFWPSAESGMVSNLARVGSFGLALPFMLYGLWVAIQRWRQPMHAQQRAHMLLLWSFMIIYTAIHLLTWTLIRYRLPVDAVLLLFAALGVVDLLERQQLLKNNNR